MPSLIVATKTTNYRPKDAKRPAACTACDITWTKSRRQFIGGAFLRPWLARVLARFTRARGGCAGHANFLVVIQTANKCHGLANFLVWSDLVVIQTHPICVDIRVLGLGCMRNLSDLIFYDS